VTAWSTGSCGCGARWMADSAALLVEEVLPCKPLRQWVLSWPFALRFLLATNPQLLTQVLGIVYRTISGDLLHAAGRTRSTAATGAVTLIQRLAARSTSTFTCTCCFSMAFTFEQRWERARRRSRCFSVWQRQAAQRVAERIGRALERQGYWYETASRAISRSIRGRVSR